MVMTARTIATFCDAAVKSLRNARSILSALTLKCLMYPSEE
jgi:hypothetical protein